MNRLPNVPVFLRRDFALRFQFLLWPCLAIATAQAQEISTETTTPVATSTIDNGAAADIVITEEGSIVLGGTAGQVAVIVDSDNSVTNEGVIQFDDTNSVTGIYIGSGLSGDIVNSGSIILQEDYTREDEDEDDDLDGSIAVGEDRFGIQLEPGGTHTGDIVLESSSIVTVEGNSSAGVQLQSSIDGDVAIAGIVGVVGDSSVGVSLEEGATGDVRLDGFVSAQGSDAQGVRLDGDIGGNLTTEGSILASGFTNTSVSNYIPPSLLTDETLAVADRIDAEDLNDTGPALAIGGSLANGFLINGNFDDFTSTEDSEDETKDTIEDFDENRSTGSITSIGSGPAISITPDLGGSGTGDIVFGTVVETVRDTLDDDEDDDFTEILATFDYDQGLINRGSITANGLNIGYAATGLQISGSADGRYSTEIVGGILNAGGVQATAFEADATAIDLQSGAVVGTLFNEGAISATTNTVAGHDATALRIDQGAELSGVENSGSIFASSNGDSGNAYGIWDQSGQLSNIQNTGSITAVIFDDGLTDTDLGEAVAIDLSLALTDIDISQIRATPVEDINADDVIDSDDVSDPTLTGNVRLGSGNDTFIVSAGTVAGDVDFGLGDAEMTLSSMTYVGDIDFIDGENALSVSDSSVTGDVNFGGTGGTFNLISSTFDGRLVSAGGLRTFTASDSELLFSSDTAATLETLTFSGETLFQVDLDPRISAGNPTLTVQGAAMIGEGVAIRPVLETITSTDFTHTFVAANDITFEGELDDALVEDAPFIYAVSLVLNEGDTDTLDLEFNLKSASELGLDLNQANAYSAVLDLFSSDDELGAALATITDADDFVQTYNLLLPQRTDASTRFLSTQSSAAVGALSNRLKTINRSGDATSGFWVQEYFNQIDIDAATDMPGYNGGGLGLAAGFDRRFAFLDTAGVFVSYSSGRFEEKTGGKNPVTTSSFGLGMYANESIGPIDLVASGQVSKIDFNSTRELTLGATPYEIDGEWGGTSLSGSVGASSQLERGNFFVRPSVSIDYFQLEQEAYAETGNDLIAVAVESAETDRVSASAGLALGAEFALDRTGTSFILPELTIGYRDEISAAPYSTNASFLGADESFSILSQEEFSDALLAGFSVSTNSSLLAARIGYDAEISDKGIVHFGGATLKLKF